MDYYFLGVKRMRLYSSNASGYSRKVRIVAIELGLDARLERIDQSPRDNSTGFFAVSPLARIPVLLTDEGYALYDSPVICEYLNTLAGGSLIPATGVARWNALRRQALGDGILDNGLPLRGELMRRPAMLSAEVVARHREAIERALTLADAEADAYPTSTPDIGTIAIGCAVGWLDFRMPDFGWRANRPQLAAWLAELGQRPSFAATRPE